MKRRKKKDNSYMKSLLYLLLFYPCFLYGQQATLSGSIDYKYRFGKDYLPIKICISSNGYLDSTVMDSSFNFNFRNLKNGIYRLKISSLSGQTGFKDILVTDISITDRLILYPITIQKAKLCESAPVILGKRKEKEFYKTGELLAEGKYIHSFYKIGPHKKTVPYYKKNGVWKYYLKTGQLDKTLFYKDDNLTSFTTFYPNGNKKQSGNYNFGCQTGDWKNFSEDGTLRYVVNFDDLSLIKINNAYLQNYMQSLTSLNN